MEESTWYGVCLSTSVFVGVCVCVYFTVSRVIMVISKLQEYDRDYFSTHNCWWRIQEHTHIYTNQMNWFEDVRGDISIQMPMTIS